MSRLTRDGTADPSRDIKFSGANGDRKIFIFPVQLSRIDNLSRLILTVAVQYVMTIHAYLVHTTVVNAVNTIVPRSPLFVFCAPKYRLLQT